MQKDSSNTFTPGPTPNTVRAADGRVSTAPEGWILLPPGDAALTRRAKAAGDHWVVQEKKGRKVFSRGVWAPAATIERIRAHLEAERSTESFAKKKEGDACRRESAQTLAGADRGHQKRLEAFLHGHWRESRLSSPFISKGDYFFSSTISEVIRVDDQGKEARFSTEVIERNYSSGMLKLRLSCPNLGLQFDVSLVDGETLRTQITDFSLEANGFRAVREDTRPEFANEWAYIDKKERP
jgi:hypothetical protein